MALVPYVNQKQLDKITQLLSKLPHSIHENSSACVFFMQTFTTLLQRGKQHPEFVLAPVESLFTEDFVKGVTHHANEMGVNGLDIIEMLELLRTEYSKHTSLEWK